MSLLRPMYPSYLQHKYTPTKLEPPSCDTPSSSLLGWKTHGNKRAIAKPVNHLETTINGGIRLSTPSSLYTHLQRCTRTGSKVQDPSRQELLLRAMKWLCCDPCGVPKYRFKYSHRLQNAEIQVTNDEDDVGRVEHRQTEQE